MRQDGRAGPLLFLIIINDLDLAVSLAELLVKFADDTKLARVIRDEEDGRGLQAALDGLMYWAHTWGGEKLEVTKEERDLGVIVSDSLKPAAQCAQATRSAQFVLGQNMHAFQYRDRSVFTYAAL
jgi:hypothetical protein